MKEAAAGAGPAPAQLRSHAQCAAQSDCFHHVCACHCTVADTPLLLQSFCQVLVPLLLRSAVVELKFSSQKKHPTHSTRHASRGVCARSRRKHGREGYKCTQAAFIFKRQQLRACSSVNPLPPPPLLPDVQLLVQSLQRTAQPHSVAAAARQLRLLHVVGKQS